MDNSLISLICNLAWTFLCGFDDTAIKIFREFIKRHPTVNKWNIASDYSDGCYSFIISPAPGSPQESFDLVQSKLPKDIKEVRDISEDAISFLYEADKFIIAFKVKGKAKLFGDNFQARNYIDTEYQKASKIANPETLKMMKELYKKSLNNNFNLSLFTNLIMLSSFFVFISSLLSRESPAEIIGWFSDRDKMTSYCYGVIWVFSMQSFKALSDSIAIKFPQVFIGGSAEIPEPMWYDSWIRTADYISGALSHLDISVDGTVKKADTKQYQILSRVIADNENIIIFQLEFVNYQPVINRIIISQEMNSSTQISEIFHKYFGDKNDIDLDMEDRNN